MLDDADYLRQWRLFTSRFGFRLSKDTPAIDEPAPSVTFDLGPVFARDTAGFAAAADVINAEVLRAFVWQLPDRRRILALDVNHQFYWLDPAEHACAETSTSWPITPFPNGDYHGFFTTDFTEGTFGHPWEQTLVVIGPRLVATLGASLRTWLPVKRIDGRPESAASAQP